MNTAVFTLLNSGVALAGVALGAWLGARNSGRQWTREAQLQACQRLMDQYAVLYDGLARSRRGEVPDLAWSSWNQALTGISFICINPVVEAAYFLDEELWRVDWEIRGGKIGQGAWLELRRPVETARAALVHAVRRQFNSKFRQPVRTLGRPADEDPMWSRQP